MKGDIVVPLGTQKLCKKKYINICIYMSDIHRTFGEFCEEGNIIIDKIVICSGYSWPGAHT